MEQGTSAESNFQDAARWLDGQVLQNQVIEIGVQGIQEPPHEEATEESPGTSQLICQESWWAEHPTSRPR
jgi:hypothetical protein